MANTLKFKRGLVAGLPTAALGEPLFTTDTFDLYIGNGTGNTRFQKYIASGATTQILRGDGSLYTFPLAISSPSNGQVLKYNGTSWVNDSDSGITGSGTAGQVAYFTGASTQGGSNNLFWDNTNGRLGIGTNTPSYLLHAFINSNAQLYFQNVSQSNLFLSGTNATLLINNTGGSFPGVRLQHTGTSVGGMEANATSSIDFISLSSGIPILFRQVSNERARFFASTGNFGINTGTSDSGQRLQVNGTGYFSDKVGIGVGTPNEITLNIRKNITGATSAYGIYLGGDVQNDVTANLLNYYSRPNVASGTTLSNLYHYAIDQGTYTGTVTNQYGFWAGSSLTGATNNYGFYGNIASGTNRWNLYMNGTANNYINGSVGIGVTNPALKLDVVGAIGARGRNYVTSFDASTGDGIFMQAFAGYGELKMNNNGHYLSFVIGTTERMRLDASGNLGLGVTPSAWSVVRGLQVGVSASLGGYAATTEGMFLSSNSFYNGGAFVRQITGNATQYLQISGQHRWSTAASDTAGTSITFTQAMTLDASGNLLVGSATSSGEKLQVTGTAKITGATFIGGGLTVQQTSNTYGFTLAQSNALNAGWGMWADTSGNYNLSRYGGGTYNSPALIISLSNAATLSSSLSVAGNLTVDTNTLFVDATNNRVGIGTASPSYGLDVQTTSNTVGIRAASNTANDILYYATGTVTGSLNAFVTSINATGGVGGQLLNSNSASGSAFLDINVTSASTGDPYLSLTTSGATNWSIGIDNSDSDKLKIGPNSNPSVGSASMTMFTGGNIAIGTTTDSGYKLRVNGTGYFDDNVRFPNTKGLLFENSSASAVGSIKMATGVTNPLEITNGTNTITLVAIGTAISSNLLVGAANIGTSATNTLVLGTGTAPSSSPTDSVQIYSADITAGNAAPHFRTENGAVIKLYQETTSVGNSIISLGGGNAVLDDTTFDGYTLRQIVKALRNQGILA